MNGDYSGIIANVGVIFYMGLFVASLAIVLFKAVSFTIHDAKDNNKRLGEWTEDKWRKEFENRIHEEWETWNNRKWEHVVKEWAKISFEDELQAAKDWKIKIKSPTVAAEEEMQEIDSWR